MVKIPENVSIIIKAIIPLIVVVVLFFFLGGIGFTKISEVQGQISKAKSDQLMLTQKLDLLRTVSVDGVKDSNVVTNSLPDSSPALLVTSQLRNLAAGSGLILSSIKSQIDLGDTDLKSVTVSFNISGEKSVVQSFLSNISTIAPITILNKVKIVELNGVYSGEIVVNSFWSDLPTQLPVAIDEFQDLTEVDKQMLTIVSGLTQPIFINLPPADGSGKENPFVK